MTQIDLPCWASLLTCGLMLWGMPPSTRERRRSERGRTESMSSQVRSPTVWLWVNSRWACQRNRCWGSSRCGEPSVPSQDLGFPPSEWRVSNISGFCGVCVLCNHYINIIKHNATSWTEEAGILVYYSKFNCNVTKRDRDMKERGRIFLEGENTQGKKVMRWLRGKGSG